MKYNVEIEYGPHQSTTVVVDAKDEKQAMKVAVEQLLKDRPSLASRNPYASRVSRVLKYTDSENT